MKKDYTDKELLAMGKKVKKRVLFKDYVGTYCNLGLQNRDMKTIRKELPAIAKRASELVIRAIIRKTRMPTRFSKNEKPFITIIIYAGIADETNKAFIYPNPTEDFKLEEV